MGDWVVVINTLSSDMIRKRTWTFLRELSSQEFFFFLPVTLFTGVNCCTNLDLLLFFLLLHPSIFDSINREFANSGGRGNKIVQRAFIVEPPIQTIYTPNEQPLLMLLCGGGFCAIFLGKHTGLYLSYSEDEDDVCCCLFATNVTAIHPFVWWSMTNSGVNGGAINAAYRSNLLWHFVLSKYKSSVCISRPFPGLVLQIIDHKWLLNYTVCLFFPWYGSHRQFSRPFQMAISSLRWFTVEIEANYIYIRRRIEVLLVINCGKLN